MTTYDTLAVAPGRVYHSEFGTKPSEWRSTGLSGRLVFGRDGKAASNGSSDSGSSKFSYTIDSERYWLRLIEDSSEKLLWVYRISAGFQYHLDKPFFHVFRGKASIHDLQISPTLAYRLPTESHVGLFVRK